MDRLGRCDLVSDIDGDTRDQIDMVGIESTRSEGEGSEQALDLVPDDDRRCNCGLHVARKILTNQDTRIDDASSAYALAGFYDDAGLGSEPLRSPAVEVSVLTQRDGDAIGVRRLSRKHNDLFEFTLEECSGGRFGR